MKTQTYSEVEALRAEVSELRATVGELEARINEYEAGDDDRWAIWPYSWIVSGWEKTQVCLHTLHDTSNRRAVLLQSEKPTDFTNHLQGV